MGIKSTTNINTSTQGLVKRQEEHSGSNSYVDIQTGRIVFYRGAIEVGSIEFDTSESPDGIAIKGRNTGNNEYTKVLVTPFGVDIRPTSTDKKLYINGGLAFDGALYINEGTFGDVFPKFQYTGYVDISGGVIGPSTYMPTSFNGTTYTVSRTSTGVSKVSHFTQTTIPESAQINLTIYGSGFGGITARTINDFTVTTYDETGTLADINYGFHWVHRGINFS